MVVAWFSTPSVLTGLSVAETAEVGTGEVLTMNIGCRSVAVFIMWIVWPSIVLLGGVDGFAVPVATEVPLAKDRADSLARCQRKTESAFIRDLAEGNGDTIFSGTISVAPGRYRLHAPMAIHPLGDMATAWLTVKLQADTTEKTFNALVFPLSDEFTDLFMDFLFMDFTPRNRDTAVTVSWAFEEGESSALSRRKSIAVPTANTSVLNNEITDFPDLEDPDAPRPIEQAKAIKECLLLRSIHVEPLSPIAIAAVYSDKITYQRGEKGHVTVELHNASPQPQAVSLVVEIQGGIDQVWPVKVEAVSIPADSSLAWKGEFATTDLSWGCSLQATATVGEFPPEHGEATFSVPDHFWDVAVMAQCPAQMTQSFVSMEAARKSAALLKSQGYNGFEAYFWAPCDFLDYTPDTEVFFSGQTAYVQTIAGTRNIIAACHELGIKATFYANLWGGSGEPAFEMMRRHPDWFGSASFHSGALDDASLRTAGIIRGAGQKVWSFNQLNPEANRGLFDFHVGEILKSCKIFGWDGIRYDSYYSAPWTIKAMTHIRERMNQELPAFLFGYNAFADAEYRAGAMDSTSRGMIMAEGARIGTGSSIADYLHGLNLWREVSWPYGSAIGPLYGFTNGTKGKPSPLDHLLMASVYMSVGAHPYYNLMGGGFGEYPAFAVRYAEMIYNTRLRDVADPERIVAFGNQVEPLLWRELVRTCTLKNGRQRLVLHVVNSAATSVFGDLGMRHSPPLKNVPIRFTLPDGAKPLGAWVMQAYPAACQQSLPLVADGSSVTLMLPDVRFYGMVVIEFESNTPIPTRMDARARRAMELKKEK